MRRRNEDGLIRLLVGSSILSTVFSLVIIIMTVIHNAKVQNLIKSEN